MLRPSHGRFLLPILLGLPGSAAAQELVKNINIQPFGAGQFELDSDPTGFAVADGVLYFSAFTEASGRELFRLDTLGAKPQLVADLTPGEQGSDPIEIVGLPNGRVVFVASRPDTGFELFGSDGTEAGTVLLQDFAPGPEDSFPFRLTEHQGEVYLFASDEAFIGLSLWKTDGTLDGTLELEEAPAGGSFSNAQHGIVSTPSGLFFSTGFSQVPQGIWRLFTSDGTPGGATLLREESDSSGFQGVRELTAAGKNVAFRAAGALTSSEPWVSDGTALGTLVLELEPGSGSSSPQDFVSLGDEAFFFANDPVVGRQIFKTDGTALGTSRVTDLPSGPGAGFAFQLSAAQGQVFFSYSDQASGNELWATTGDFGAERLFADFAPGPESSDPDRVIEYGPGVICRARSADSGFELYGSAGTPETSYLLVDIVPGTGSSDPFDLTAFDGGLVFSADGFFGREPWVTNGTTDGTLLVSDLAVTPYDDGSFPDEAVALGDRIVFSANDGQFGRELWVSDGTAAGTELLFDFEQDDDPNDFFKFVPLAYDGRAFFRADFEGQGVELWSTDGTPEGTSLVIDLWPGTGSSNPLPLLVWNGLLYFQAEQPGLGAELFVTDGTEQGTSLVKDISAGSGSSAPSSLTPHDGRLYFSARTQEFGTELWRTDGTEAGTELVIDLNAGPASSMSALESASFGSFLYFSGSPAANASEVWRTDGTAVGTQLFADLNPTSGSFPDDYQTIGDRLVFRAFVAGDRCYWGTDGNTLSRLSAVPLSADTNWRLHATSEQLITVLRGPGASGGSFELWGTDGTPAGSGVIEQIAPDGSDFVNLRAWHTTSGPKLLFTAADAVVGSELWVTDGTAAGTFNLIDLVPGPGNSNPTNLVRMGSSVYFTAFTIDTGWELYSLPIAAFPDYVAEPFGLGCIGPSGAVPEMTAQGTALMGNTLTARIEGGAPNSVALYYAAPAYQLTVVGSCSAYLASPQFLASTLTDAAGATEFSFPVPSEPNVAGAELWLQAAILEASGPLFGVASITGALEVIVQP